MHPPSRPRWYDGAIAHRARPTRIAGLVAVVLAVVPLAFLLALLAACSEDASPGEARADQVRDVAVGAGLPDEVADVLADAARADGTYQVTYELEEQTLTVTQRPPDRRVDTTFSDGTVDAVISVDGETHACTDPAGAEGWRCDSLGEPPPVGAFDTAAVDALADALVAGAARYDYSVEQREVAGAPARCLVTRLRPAAAADPSLGAEGTLCLAESGAILLVERPTGTLRATAYATDVPDGAFTPPA